MAVALQLSLTPQAVWPLAASPPTSPTPPRPPLVQTLAALSIFLVLKKHLLSPLSAQNMFFLPTPALSDIAFSRKSTLGSRPTLFIPLCFLHHSVYSAGVSSAVYLSISTTVVFLLLGHSPTHPQGRPLYFLQPVLAWLLSSAYHSYFPPTITSYPPLPA